MKFEQVLQFYWSKGFLFSGRIIPFDTTLQNFFSNVGGLGLSTKLQITRRFELYLLYFDRKKSFKVVSKDLYRPINILLSQISTVNNQVSELVRFYHIRLYLTKTFRGRAQALGKPSRGQRTWSNAWSAYNNNRTVRQFVSLMQKTLKSKKTTEKVDYRKIQKKVKKPIHNPLKVKKVIKKSIWF